MINQPRGKDQTVPYGTDSRLDVFQAINCLATIIWSLRDKHICVLMLTRMRGRGKARSTLWQIFCLNMSKRKQKVLKKKHRESSKPVRLGSISGGTTNLIFCLRYESFMIRNIFDVRYRRFIFEKESTRTRARRLVQ